MHLDLLRPSFLGILQILRGVQHSYLTSTLQSSIISRLIGKMMDSWFQHGLPCNPLDYSGIVTWLTR